MLLTLLQIHSATFNLQSTIQKYLGQICQWHTAGCSRDVETTCRLYVCVYIAEKFTEFMKRIDSLMDVHMHAPYSSGARRAVIPQIPCGLQI